MGARVTSVLHGRRVSPGRGGRIVAHGASHGMRGGIQSDLPPSNGSRPYVRIMRFLDLKGRSDDGEETAHWRADHIEATRG